MRKSFRLHRHGGTFVHHYNFLQVESFHYITVFSGNVSYQFLVLSMEGVPKDSAKEKAETIFKSLDTNGDGALDEVEFCAGCLRDPEFANMIQAGVDKLKTEQDFAQKIRKAC